MTTKYVLASLLIAGTGSSYPLNNAKTWKAFVQPRASLDFEQVENLSLKMDLRTPAEHLQNIRTVLNPPISELAVLFDVSRQAIYKWLSEESQPEADKLLHITKLSQIADAFQEAGIHRGGALLNMKLFEGQSLLDLLKARQPYEKQVRELIAEAQIMETAYQKSGLAQSNARPTNDWLSSVSIPAHHEET